MPLGAAQNAVAAATQSLSSAGTNAGTANGSPARQKDRAEAETAPQFGELLQNIQSKYGARPEKGREIKKTLGKDDFLRIMITQMKNQDPTNPFKAEQMATQMAQFTTVEQLKNMNESMTKMTTANQPLERMAMTGMIGKTVTIDRGRFPHTEGQNEQLSFGLPRDAAQVTVSLISDKGETVLQKEIGKAKAGENSFTWDGKKVNTLPASTGNYMIKIDAQDEKGQRIETNSQTTARVVGVSFEGSEPVFLVGDNKHQEKITMKNIVRIDDLGGGGAVPGTVMAQALAQVQGSAPAQSAAPGAAAGGAPQGASGQPKSAPAFFSFQKGVGSTTLDPSADAQKLAAAYRPQSAAPAEMAARPAPQQGQAPGMAQQGGRPEEKGFPNGLHDN